MESDLPSSIVSTLRSKATRARKKIQYKRDMDPHCDANETKHFVKYKVFSLNKFLSQFLDPGTLDLSHKQYGRVVRQNLQHVENVQYIFLTDKHQSMDIDNDWLQRQNEYIRSLSTEDLFNVYGYTYHGDVFVNYYLRGTFDVPEFKEHLRTFDVDNERYFPLFFPAIRAISKYGETTIHLVFDTLKPSEDAVAKAMSLQRKDVNNSDKYRILMSIAKDLSYDRFWVSVLEMYRDALEKIIRNAPATTQPMVLYRGVSTDYYLTKFMTSHKDRIHIANSFVSTTSAISVAADYVDFDTTNCCFMRMFVPKGTQMLLMAGISLFNDESEFLLGHKSQFYITKSSTEVFCKGNLNFKMRVTDLVVIQ